MKPLPVVSISVLEGEGFLRQAVIFRNCWAEEAKCGGRGAALGCTRMPRDSAGLAKQSRPHRHGDPFVGRARDQSVLGKRVRREGERHTQRTTSAASR